MMKRCCGNCRFISAADERGHHWCNHEEAFYPGWISMSDYCILHVPPKAEPKAGGPMTPLEWTRTKPSKPGFYWYRNNHVVWVTQVVREETGELCAEWGSLLETVIGEWSHQPIDPPREAREEGKQ